MLDDLKRQIRKLSEPELLELRRYINNWRPTAGPSESTLWTVETFAAECESLVLGFVQPPVKRLVSNHTPELESFLQDACRATPGLKLITKRAIFSSGLKLLHKNLVEIGIPVSPRVLANHMPRLPAVLDIAFPGYSYSGMLRMIVKKGDNEWLVRSERPSIS